MSKSKMITVAAIVALSTAAGSAMAQGTGAFVEGTLGKTKVDLGNTSGWTVNNKDTTYGLTAGYMFNEFVGIEGGYRDFGDVSASVTGTLSGNLYGKPFVGTGTLALKADADGWLLGTRFNLPINQDFSLVGRVGYLFWDARANASLNAAYTWGGTAYAANASASNSDKGNDVYWGLGGAYNINKQVAVGLNYNRFKLDAINVDTWDLSLKYRF